MPRLFVKRLDRFSLSSYLLTASLLGLGAVLLLAAAHLRDVPVIRMLRDPASYYDYSPFSGIISYAGIGLMTSTAAICGFATWVGCRWRGLLAGVAGFSGYFALDDLFMLHEGVWPRFGIPEEVVMTLFGLSGLAILLGARSQARREWPWGLYIALALMAGSLLIDMMLQSGPATVAEDLLKFTATGVWALFWTGAASGAVTASAASAPADSVITPEIEKWR